MKYGVGTERRHLNKVKDSFSLDLLGSHPLLLVLKGCQLGLPARALDVPALQLRVCAGHLQPNRAPGGLQRNSPRLMGNITLVSQQTHSKPFEFYVLPGCGDLIARENKVNQAGVWQMQKQRVSRLLILNPKILHTWIVSDTQVAAEIRRVIAY